MAIEQLLAGMGAVPSGVRPKHIDLSRGETEATWQDTSTLGRVVQGLKDYMQQQQDIEKKRQEEEKKRQEEVKKQVDMYNTLRNAGYSSKDAFDTVKSGKFPAMPGGATLEEKKLEVKEGKLTETGKYRQDILRAKKGEIDWDELRDMYGDKIEQINKIESQTKPITKSPSFIKGTGGLISRFKSWRSPQQAEINASTQTVIDYIKTEEQLQNLIKNYKTFEENDVDVDAILEYFGRAGE